MAVRAATLIGSAVVLGLDDTLPQPTIQLVDGDGDVITDLSDYSAATMEFYDVAGNVFTETGVIGADTITFPITPANTTAATYRHTFVVLTNTDGTFTLSGPPFAVVDYSALWTDVATVRNIVGPDYTDQQIVLAILAAEAAVRAWVTAPITSPVSERVRRATALLGARALTTTPPGEQIASETMGDYTVRYADPSSSGLVIEGEIASLLSPWKPNVYSTYTGPKGTDGPSTFADLWVE